MYKGPVMRYFSGKNRPFHLGPFPMELLKRDCRLPDLSAVPGMKELNFESRPHVSIAHSIARFIAMLDTVRDGVMSPLAAEIPECPSERARHMKASCCYFDVSMVGITRLESKHFLTTCRRNPMIDGIRTELEAGQPTTYAAGVDAIYADVLDAAGEDLARPEGHQYAIVMAVEHTREPSPDEPGCEWIADVQDERSALLTANAAVVIANYIRMLGFEARCHTLTTTDLDLNRLAVSAGLAVVREGKIENPFVGERIGYAAVSTTLEMEADKPLAQDARESFLKRHRLAWKAGSLSERRAATAIPFRHRQYSLGPHPFEQLKRVPKPTTFIDEDRVPRFPKRADFFARALFGDMGKSVQDSAKGAYYVMKSPMGGCARRALGALLLLQFGDARGPVHETVGDPVRNASNIKAASYYLATDAVGLSRAPDWTYYSHDAGGNPITPYHDSAVSMLFDQGFDTMEGGSGDDWISVAQSMRAYLRFSLIGGVVAEQIRRLGYSARVHSVLDSEVLQPPLLLLSGLGEVSRIGEVILNPFLGPRLKSGTVTTSMPMTHDNPIDFGLQNFCRNCNKCARECPSGAITAGPKLMYNGYEIWKSDAEKCARYRLTNTAGGMCGRCMKTCPWNLQGLFSEAPFRWMASNVSSMARPLAWLDDAVGRGRINPVKKWWWDIELDRSTGRYVMAKSTNTRNLQRDLDLQYEDQTLAVYPADVMPLPYPIAQPLDREEGIRRYRTMLTPEQYGRKLEEGDTEGLVPTPPPLAGPPPVIPVIVTRRTDFAEDLARFVLQSADNTLLPPFEAGAHVDVVIAPEYQRQFSLAGDPSDRSNYVLGVQNENDGRGGSSLMFRIFREGRKSFISRPRNHFPLDEDAEYSLLMGGGIGITPLVSMASRLFSIGREFEMHYSVSRHDQAAFKDDIANAPWADRAHMYCSNLGTRADLGVIIPVYKDGYRLYTCGSDRYMNSVFEQATNRGWPEDSLLREYFVVPEPPERENHPFVLELAHSGRKIEVPADRTALEALADTGIHIDTKCSDGICGVCEVRYLAGEVEHRDYVLAARDRKEKMLVCCSRAAEKDGTITIDL